MRAEKINGNEVENTTSNSPTGEPAVSLEMGIMNNKVQSDILKISENDPKWQQERAQNSKGAAAEDGDQSNESAKAAIRSDAVDNKCAFLWSKFPKFIIGYVGLSLIISVLIIPLSSEDYSARFIRNIHQFSKWLFTLGFVGIGAKTKFTSLWDSIKDGKYLTLYLLGQTFDTIITFVFAFVVFTYIV